MQHVVVCAQDSVLAKKVRFLLAGDDRNVEILESQSELSATLQRGPVDLLILSRMLHEEDAIELLGRSDPSFDLPPTIILGGEEVITADFIRIIPDPVDTNAIYEIASQLLSTSYALDHELTQMTSQRPALPRSTTQTDGEPTGKLPSHHTTDQMAFQDVTGINDIADRLDEIVDDEMNEHLTDAFEIDEDSIVPSTKSRRPAPSDATLAGGPLEPERLAKTLFLGWSREMTGALIIARDHETLTVYLDRGAPVHIESSIPGDQLGVALVERGRITDAQYSEGAKRAIEKGIRLGQALIDLGFFTKEELGHELGATARDRIVRCFEARAGSIEFDARQGVPTDERPYRLDVAHIIAEGIRRFADEAVLAQVLGEIDNRYFKLRRPIADLSSTYPIAEKETQFLLFEGRAYNVNDAAESAGLSSTEAHKLMTLLTICEEVEDFTPGVKEFEDRIKEERQRTKDLESHLPMPSPALPAPSEPPLPPPTAEPLRPAEPILPPRSSPGALPLTPSNPPTAWPPAETQPPMPGSSPFNPGPLSAPQPTLAPQSSTAVPTTSNGEEIPPMPVPSGADEGMVPRQLVYANPLPRGPDGSAIETSERTLSREHFQRGVTLLGQGNFANAEEAFRDAVALCSEEHVYLIGLARAIYYNPAYQANGKIPVLRSIVDRAQSLAPEDKRVATLKSWVDHAETQFGGAVRQATA